VALQELQIKKTGLFKKEKGHAKKIPYSKRREKNKRSKFIINEFWGLARSCPVKVNLLFGQRGERGRNREDEKTQS